MIKKICVANHSFHRLLAGASVAALLALSGTGTGIAAEQQPGQGAGEPPAKIEAAPGLAPGIAPGVVPGAHPGGEAPQPGIAPGVVPGAQPGGMGGGAPGATGHPAFSPSPVTPEQNAAVDYSPSAVIGSPDWPCIQRKVPTISAGQIWDGPSIDGITEFSPEIRDLTAILESRRIPAEEAEKAIKEFAEAQPEAERDKRLTELFASYFTRMNADRSFVLNKVEEFQRRQKARAAELEREGQKLAEKGLSATEELLPTETNLSPEQQEYNWNARIFQERQQNLTLACEVPQLIEERAFEIARRIREQMKS